jgi:ABC-type phosphate transport system permease subunit
MLSFFMISVFALSIIPIGILSGVYLLCEVTGHSFNDFLEVFDADYL